MIEEEDLEEEEEAAAVPVNAGKMNDDGKDVLTTLTEDQLLPPVAEKEEILIGVGGRWYTGRAWVVGIG